MRTALSLPVTPILAVLEPLVSPDHHPFLDPVSVLLDNPTQAAEADSDGDVAAAIAILVGRFPVSYTKAFALMLAYRERTRRTLPHLAAAVLKTYAPAIVSTSP
jgi:hypothetical protein